MIVSQIKRAITRGLDILASSLLAKHRHVLSKKDYHRIMCHIDKINRPLHAVVKIIIYDTPYADYLKAHPELAYDLLDNILYDACIGGFYETANLMMADERNATLLKSLPYLKELVGDLIEEERSDVLVLLIRCVCKMNTDRITKLVLEHGCRLAIYKGNIQAFRLIMLCPLIDGIALYANSIFYSIFLENRQMLDMMLKDPDLKSKYDPSIFNNYAVRHYHSERDYVLTRTLLQDERVGKDMPYLLTEI